MTVLFVFMAWLSGSCSGARASRRYRWTHYPGVSTHLEIPHLPIQFDGRQIPVPFVHQPQVPSTLTWQSATGETLASRADAPAGKPYVLIAQGKAMQIFR